MADGYVVMSDLFPAAMFLAIRVALTPSSPRRTILVTAMVGIRRSCCQGRTAEGEFYYVLGYLDGLACRH